MTSGESSVWNSKQRIRGSQILRPQGFPVRSLIFKKEEALYWPCSYKPMLPCQWG